MAFAGQPPPCQAGSEGDTASGARLCRDGGGRPEARPGPQFPVRRQLNEDIRNLGDEDSPPLQGNC